MAKWSRLGLRAKALVIVTLTALPMLFLFALLIAALVRQAATPAPATARARGQAAAPNTARGRVFGYVFLGGSIALTVGGFAAAFVLGNNVRRRAMILMTNANRIVSGQPLAPLPPVLDEIGQLGDRLVEVHALLREREALAEQASQSLDRFFQLSNDLFCIAGFDGYFKRLNPSWERVLGVPTKELMAVPFMDWIHPDDRERTAAEAAGLASGDSTLSFENRYRAKDGSYRWFRWSARAQMDEQLIYASARDITDERAADERQVALNTELRAQSAQLEAANHELEAFSYSVSHDLRAPLRAIDGFSQVLEEDFGPTLDPLARDSLRRVRAGASRMGVLIDDLLGLSRLTRMELRREPVDLGAIAGGIATELARRHPAQPVEISIAPDLHADADPRMLRIALENLLDNAWKYTSKTAQARVEVGRHTNGGTEPAFFVRDNGAGFDMAYADKLFGAFQRLHAEREFPGTGIGLATVQRIVNRHGGKIWASSAVGAGATFYFTLKP